MTQANLFDNEDGVDEGEVDYLSDLENESVEEFQAPSSALSIKQLVFEALDHFKSSHGQHLPKTKYRRQKCSDNHSGVKILGHTCAQPIGPTL